MFGIRFGHVKEAWAKTLVVFSCDGIVLREIYMVREEYQVALLQALPDASGGVRYDQRLDAEQPQHANGEGYFFRGIAFIGMHPSLHHGHRYGYDYAVKYA